VILPADNEKDLSEIPSKIKRGLEILFVRHMDEVIGTALAGWTPAPQVGAPAPEEAVPPVAAPIPPGSGDPEGGVIQHH
jgi:ATP-dependent Lon protease